MNGTTQASGSSAVTQSTLQAEQQAIADMNAITQNQIQFNTHMNDAKAAHQAANSFQLNA